MSRQYLKQLKERAQRLLDRSSGEEEEEEEINAYTATQGTRSPQRIILDQPPSDHEEVSQFYQHDTTDIEMLKRCIALTNQNNNLKFLVEKLSAQVDSLKNDLKICVEKECLLRKQLQNKEAAVDKRDNSRVEQLMQMMQKERKQLQRQRAALRIKQQEVSQQQVLIKQQLQQCEQMQSKQFKGTRKQRGKEEGSQIEVHNDYTIRTQKRDDYERLKMSNEELQRRIGRLEGLVRQQRSKSNRLCKFISKEVPALNAIIVQLTAKLDAKFQKRILQQLAL